MPSGADTDSQFVRRERERKREKLLLILRRQIHCISQQHFPYNWTKFSGSSKSDLVLKLLKWTIIYFTKYFTKFYNIFYYKLNNCKAYKCKMLFYFYNYYYYYFILFYYFCRK